MINRIFNLTNLTLLVALALSTIAAYYSIIGLTAIFAGAVIPVIVMGSILEIGKIITTVWLRTYWDRAGWLLKIYLVPAVVLIALLTSMGIFGFLSKAHSEQNVTSGDIQAKLAIIDEKIKTQRDNIELSRKALGQLDAQVDQRLSRGTTEQGAERAVVIRRQQAPERAKLQKDISDAQIVIAKLNEERAPIAAENRKVEAEVGPIKYIAALIYGDNTDLNTLENAVRWVIILLVIVFDPLAIALVLAANQSREWDKEKFFKKPEPIHDTVKVEQPEEKPIEKEEIKIEDKFDISKHSYLFKPFVHVPSSKPVVYNETKIEESKVEIIDIEPKKKATKKSREVKKPDIQVNPVENKQEVKINNSNNNSDAQVVYIKPNSDYIEYDGKNFKKDAFLELFPGIKLVPDTERKMSIGFGVSFPPQPRNGDMFSRIDMVPNRVYKYNGAKWIEVDRNKSSTYLTTDYLQFLVAKISSGEYELELLTEQEQEAIEKFLKTNLPKDVK